jgi:2-succinyl-6-hydroxy-2,4-cyclohexadiene-1-carboxylate synthase
MTRLRLPDGVQYNVELAGPRLRRSRAGAGRPLVLLHGFTGSAAAWGAHVDAFAAHFEVLAIDLLGHGGSDSPSDPARYRMERCVEDLAHVFTRLGLDAIHLLGYSMGGRAALSFALAHPGRVQKLLLESASPGLATAWERADRVRADEALADRIERDGVQAFVDSWEKLPLFASQACLAEVDRSALRAARLRNNPPGLANSLRGMGTGAQAENWSRLHALRSPALLLAGSLDSKFESIARQMCDRMPGAALAIVPDAGHTVHLEQPAEYNRRVVEFLQERNMG